MRRLYLLAVLMLLAAVTQQQIINTKPTFCWKNSYGRGAGTLPSLCPSGKEQIGLLCYTKCPNGYKRVGFDCQQNCPAPFTDQGLFCRLVQYGRGGGYAWQFGDPIFSSSGMYDRCQRDYGNGNCEMWGAIVYPKCKPGFYSVACCICRPNTFNCSSYGFKPNSQFDISCAKSLIIGDPTPMNCASNQQKQAALCYPLCRTGYYGVGPVCWANIPKAWVDCGMGAANSILTCTSVTFNQVLSVGMLAANIVTLGASGGAEVAVNDAKLGTGLINKIKGKFGELQTLYNKNQDFVNFLNKAALVGSTASTSRDVLNFILSPNLTPADMIRITAEIVSLVDPTGVASVVAAYSYPLCSDIVL